MPKIESGVYPAEIIFTETNSNDNQIMDINQRVSAPFLLALITKLAVKFCIFPTTPLTSRISQTPPIYA